MSTQDSALGIPAASSPAHPVTQTSRQPETNDQPKRRTSRPTKVGFVFSNDPDPMLVERMWALEETGGFEAHALYWHRSSDLSFPFSAEPFGADRFRKVALPDPCSGVLSRLVLTLKFAWALAQWVRTNQFEILHVIYPNMLIAAFIATFGRRIEIVYDVWDANHSQQMSWLQSLFFRTLLSKTRLVFTTSQGFVDDFVLENDILKENARVSYVSNAPYRLPTTPRKTASSAQRFVDGPLVIGCVGNLRVPKQLQMLFDAVETVRATGRDVRIRLSGAGSRKQMVRHAADSKQFVEYTGPYDYRRDASRLYQQLDLVYAVYPLEVYNYKVHVARRLHDAVLSATPIVVSRGTHMSSIVMEEQVGWQIGDRSMEELISLLQEVYDDRSKLVAVSTNALSRRSSHAFDAYRPEYLAAYRELQATLPSRQSGESVPAPVIPATDAAAA